MRGNDGVVDPQGRYWVGTMNDPKVTEPKEEGEKPVRSRVYIALMGNLGVLFRLDPDLTLHRMIEGVTIPNGTSWSLDGKTMYFADSPTKNIWAYDFDGSTGNISNKRVFFHVEEEDGVPDGHVMDQEGYIWQAIFGCGKVVRISPEGKVVAEISLPTRCISCPGFAGEDLYITSAEEEAPDKFPDSTKLQGSLFKCHVGVKGVTPNRFKYHGEKI